MGSNLFRFTLENNGTIYINVYRVEAILSVLGNTLLTDVSMASGVVYRVISTPRDVAWKIDYTCRESAPSV